MQEAQTSWNGYKVGDKVTYTVDEFDGHFSEAKTVKEVHTDHIIIGGDAAEHIWIDEDTEYMVARR